MNTRLLSLDLLLLGATDKTYRRSAAHRAATLVAAREACGSIVVAGDS